MVVKTVTSIFGILVLSVLFSFDQTSKERIYIFYENNSSPRFNLDGEYFSHLSHKHKVDTCDISWLSNKQILTVKQLKRKESAILKKIADQREKEIGIPFPKTTMYHDLFDLYMVDQIDHNRVVIYQVDWVYLSCRSW